MPSLDPEYVTAQETALATLVMENKQFILETIATWIGGPFGAVAAFLLGQLIDECSDVNRKNRAFTDQLRQSLQTFGRLPPMQSRKCPEGVTLIPNEVRAEATEIGQPVAVPLVIACDQAVRIRWDLLGHAASPCHQDMALAWLIGSTGQQAAVVWEKSATGVARVFQPESVRSSGEEEVALKAGGYVLLTAVTGDHSTALASVSHSSVPAPPPITSRPWFRAAVAGTLAASVAGIVASRVGR